MGRVLQQADRRIRLQLRHRPPLQRRRVRVHRRVDALQRFQRRGAHAEPVEAGRHRHLDSAAAQVTGYDCAV